jgi:hypothetical protein
MQVCSLEVRERPQAHAIGWPSFMRTHLYSNLPYNFSKAQETKDL